MKFLIDFLPILLFFAAYQLKGIYVATAVAIAAGVAQALWQKLRHGQVEKMQRYTLAALLVLGGMTLVLHNPVFIKWKPTVVYWLMAAGFLVTQFIGPAPLVKRMLGHALSLPRPIWLRLNLAWSVFFVAMGFLNLYVAFNYPEPVWVNFKLFGLMGMTLGFVVAQSFYMARHTQDEPAVEKAEEET
jgi:intracellular septation protein